MFLCPSNSNGINLSRRTHLDCQKEKVEVEAAVQDVFVGDGHEDAAAAVRQDGHGRVIRQGRGRRSHLRFGSGVEGVVGLSVAELDGVVALLVVVVRGHSSGKRVDLLLDGGGRGSW